MRENPRCCEECSLPEESFAFCEDKCMLPGCPKCSFLIQIYGTGCGNIRIYYLCRECYQRLLQRGYIEP